MTQQTPVHAVFIERDLLQAFWLMSVKLLQVWVPQRLNYFCNRLQGLTKAAEISCATKIIPPKTFSTNGGALSSDFAAWPHEQPGHDHHTWKAQKYQDAKFEPISILSLTGILPTWLSSVYAAVRVAHRSVPPCCPWEWKIHQRREIQHGVSKQIMPSMWEHGTATSQPQVNKACLSSNAENPSFPKNKIAVLPSNLLK